MLKDEVLGYLGKHYNEVTFEDMWRSFDLRNKSIFRIKFFDEVKTGVCNITQIKRIIQSGKYCNKVYDSLFWIPHIFKKGWRSRFGDVIKIKSITIDLDSKISDNFENILLDLFVSWKFDNEDIPIPNYIVYSGNGVHFYYSINDFFTEYITKEERIVLSILQRRLQYKFDHIFKSKIDRIHLVQPLRVPNSRTKDGDVCVAFSVNEIVSSYKFIIEKYFLDNSTLAQSLTYNFESHKNICVNYDDLFVGCGKRDKSKKNVKSDVSDTFESINISVLNKSKLRILMYKVGHVGRNKMVYDYLKRSNHISEGFRNNLLFGISVLLNNDGVLLRDLCLILLSINENFIEEPLLISELVEIIENSLKYKRMSDEKICDYIGLISIPSKYDSDRPKIFGKIKSRVNELKVVSAIRKLQGFGKNNSVFIKEADISESYFYSLIKSGRIIKIVEEADVDMVVLHRFRKGLPYIPKSM